MMYYELLKPCDTINGEPYQQQLSKFIVEKRSEFPTKHKEIFFHHENDVHLVARPVKNYLKNSGWEVELQNGRQAGVVFFGIESANCNKDKKMLLPQMGKSLNNTIVQIFLK